MPNGQYLREIEYVSTVSFGVKEVTRFHFEGAEERKRVMLKTLFEDPLENMVAN